MGSNCSFYGGGKDGFMYYILYTDKYGTYEKRCKDKNAFYCALKLIVLDNSARILLYGRF